MSGGTPAGSGRYVRQRLSQGYGSSGDDLEDDACSRFVSQSHSIPRTRTWTEILENFLWIASAIFIVYYGDRHHNLIFLLWHDDRIRRTVFPPKVKKGKKREGWLNKCGTIGYQ